MRKLVWNLHGGGIANQLMSMEIAIGCSWLFNRELVVYDSLGAINVGKYQNISDGHITTADLFDYPIEFQICKDPREMDFDGSKYLFPAPDLTSTVCCVDKEFSFPSNEILPAKHLSYLKDFPIQNMLVGWATNSQEPVPIVFSWYKRFFYGEDKNKLNELFDLIGKIKVKDVYTNVANQISADLGDYNAVQYRGGDWSTFISNGGLFPNGVTFSDKGRLFFLLKNIESYNISSEKMVITSNIDSSQQLSVLRDRYPDVVFLEEFIESNYSTLLDTLPHRNETTLNLISAIVCANAKKFWGTSFSTYASFIHRLRNSKDSSSSFCYHDIEYLLLRDSEYSINKKEGSLMEFQEGEYPWKRCGTESLPVWTFEYKEI